MKKITANWGLKLASLIFAVIVWFLVTNINDPIISVRYTNVPVTLKNGNLITEKGQVYTILDGSDTINSVTIYGPRQIIDSLSQSNVVATADIQNLSSLNTVSIDVQTNKYNDKLEKIVLSSDVVKLNVERKASKSLALTATTSGSLSDGYVVGDVSTEQNMVRVTGPESFVNSIQKAAVDVDVTGFTSNIGTDADIILLDGDGNALDLASQGVSMNIKTVRVNIQILETKYVPVNYVVKGEPASGYAMTGEIESNPEVILIAGRSSTISAINELKVEDDKLDISGYSSDFSGTIDLSDHLPTGVYFGDKEFNGTATVVVHISPLIEETFDVSIRNISIDGSIDGYDVAIDDSEYDQVSLTLQGLRNAIDLVNANNIVGVVDINDVIEDNDLSELQAGTYSARVKWSLPSGVSAKGTVSVYLTIREKE
ncbi:CdaR family protein [Butyrivibrio sp. YAB3001]|uniref:CdaR family protein n=1 Tax=Butyrivibrio sp. YAB3001 TaxID=1520812 RepID=UPI0008F62C85|nr:CdaR family protein [Butyrivibrio sp. YAB3001]SFC17968.1 YbbR domain-containing protein [Butyrivibrio sp. YAB3001]